MLSEISIYMYIDKNAFGNSTLDGWTVLIIPA